MEVAMPLDRPTFHVRSRNPLPAIGLLALYAALVAGFVAVTWPREARLRALAEKELAVPAVGPAICACPEPAHRLQGRP